MNRKVLFFICVLFITTPILCTGMVWAYPSCGGHYFSKTTYPDEAEGETSVFTTEDWRVICGVYSPFYDCNKLEFKWYDPYGNHVPPAYAPGTPVVHYNYEGGVLVCVEGFFYISGEQVAGEERELGQYRVEFWETEHVPDVLLFTDYFQICTNPCFEVNVNGHVFNVTLLSNSTVSNFNFSKTEKKISFNVTGTDGTSGFCNVSIPEGLLWGEFSVYKDGFALVKDVDYTVTYNGTHHIFYINYIHTTHTIEVKSTEVIPEFPTWTSMLLILTVLTVTITIYKRRLLKTPIH